MRDSFEDEKSAFSDNDLYEMSSATRRGHSKLRSAAAKPSRGFEEPTAFSDSEMVESNLSSAVPSKEIQQRRRDVASGTKTTHSLSKSLSSHPKTKFVIPKKNSLSSRLNLIRKSPSKESSNFAPSPVKRSPTRKRQKSFQNCESLRRRDPWNEGGGLMGSMMYHSPFSSDSDSMSATGSLDDFDHHFGLDTMGSVVRSTERMVRHAFGDAAERVQKAKAQAKERMHNASENLHQKVHDAESLAKGVYDRIKEEWNSCHFDMLPTWMKDNEHLHFGYRPELASVSECFKSIFRIHTETGNIWTHLIGFILFTVMTIIFYVKPLCATCALDIDTSEKLIFLCFFVGAMVCLACSTLFHTMSCHSEWVSALFSRLDYVGIAILIVGSIIPWLYYSFYCQVYAKWIYITCVSAIGGLVIMVTLRESFNTPEFRVWRTVIFCSLAFISIVPVIHYMSVKGYLRSVDEASLHWMLAMGFLYLTGAVIYASRVPERFIPGRCDIWFHSHQLFHVFVILAAFVHYHGISEMAMYRLKQGTICVHELS